MSTLPTPIAEFQVGPIQVVVRYGCVRRDQYELLTQSAFPRTLKPKLAELGQVREPMSWRPLMSRPPIQDHGRSRARTDGVIMPRLSVERAEQRPSVLAIADLLANLMAAESG